MVPLYVTLVNTFVFFYRCYEDIAYSVMTELYGINRTEARKRLVTEVKSYNSTTIFEITEKFTLMKFMGHAACQTYLNAIWKGRILRNTTDLKVKTISLSIYLIDSFIHPSLPL